MHIKNIALNIVGSFLLAFGVIAFIVPFDIIVGGATGISIILHKLLGLNMSTIVFIINVVCLPIGYLFSGKELVFGSILSSLVYPIAMAIFEQIPQIQNISDSIFLSVICGGVVCGIGIGLVMKSGGSTGGLDIPCLLIGKFLHIPVNSIMKISDTCIMLGQLPFSNVTRILYGIIYTYIMTNTIGKTLTFGVDKYRIVVISEAYEEIRKTLIDHDCGVTMSYAQSGYTYTEIQKVETILPMKRLHYVESLIEQVDPEAFITVEKVTDVKGRGYTLERTPIYFDQHNEA